MGILNFEQELVSVIPPTRLFKAFILDSDNLIPKLMPGALSIQVLEGDGGIGTVKLLTFGKGSQFKSAKHRVDEINEANLTYKFRAFEIDAFKDDIESVSYIVRIIPGPDGGSIVTRSSTYHTKTDDHHSITEKLDEGKEKAYAALHAVEAYLHANPHEYN